MKVAVPKEIVANERRVALIPQAAAKLIESGMEVLVQSGAGEAASFPDHLYEKAGATLVSDAATLLGQADVVLKVQKPDTNEAVGKHEVEMMAEGAALIAFLYPLANPDLAKALAERRITAFSIDAMPRIARAQSMDALSSQSSIAGYKAALIAASSLGKYFPMMITAAGTLPPATGLVLGAGVAGLQAIATARRLGAIMEAFDVRTAAKGEVQSLGATFLEVELGEEEAEDTGGYAKALSEESQRRERELIHAHLKEADFVIATALVPGKRAPLLITEEMVRDMKVGSVIVDIAAEAGGNCELTEPSAEVVRHGVTIHGPLNLPSSMPLHASAVYSRNISGLLRHLVRDNQLHLNFEDVITRDCCITHEGRILHEATKALVQ